MSILKAILDDKRAEVTALRATIDESKLAELAKKQEAPRPFNQSLNSAPISIIAEVKKASPSKGVLVKEFDHCAIAQEFERGGAHALSVLTDKKYFGGDPAFISQIKAVVGLPVLRKDFIIDEYQVIESRALGADAILLIVAALSREDLGRLHERARLMGMAVLVETHSREEIETANSIGAEIIGVNNRDLSTFTVTLQTSIDLRPCIRRDAIAVAESGITNSRDVRVLRGAGYQAVLVGESLMTNTNRAAAVRELIPA